MRNGRGLKRGRSRTDKRIRTEVTEERPEVTERRTEVTEGAIVRLNGAMIGRTAIGAIGRKVIDRAATGHSVQKATGPSDRVVSTEVIDRKVIGRSSREASTAEIGHAVIGAIEKKATDLTETDHSARRAIAHSSRAVSGGTGVTEEGPEVVERRAEATDRSVQKVIVRSDRRVIDRSNRAVNTVAIDRKVSVGSTSRVVIGRFGPGVIGRSSRVKVGAAVAGAETIAVAVRAAVVVRGNQRSETKNRSYLAAFRSASAVSPGPTRTR